MITEIVVGRLLCRQVRDFLKAAKFSGHDIDWLESSGWIERTFTLKGRPAAVRYVVATLEAWERQMQANEAKR